MSSELVRIEGWSVVEMMASETLVVGAMATCLKGTVDAKEITTLPIVRAEGENVVCAPVERHEGKIVFGEPKTYSLGAVDPSYEGGCGGDAREKVLRWIRYSGDFPRILYG